MLFVITIIRIMLYGYYLIIDYKIEVKRFNFKTVFIAFINNFNLTTNIWLGPGSTIEINAL